MLMYPHRKFATILVPMEPAPPPPPILDPPDALTIAHNPEKGNHLLAARYLAAGSIVLRATAYAWGLTTRAWYDEMECVQ